MSELIDGFIPAVTGISSADRLRYFKSFNLSSMSHQAILRLTGSLL